MSACVIEGTRANLVGIRKRGLLGMASRHTRETSAVCTAGVERGAIKVLGDALGGLAFGVVTRVLWSRGFSEGFRIVATLWGAIVVVCKHLDLCRRRAKARALVGAGRGGERGAMVAGAGGRVLGPPGHGRAGVWFAAAGTRTVLRNNQNGMRFRPGAASLQRADLETRLRTPRDSITGACSIVATTYNSPQCHSA